MTKQKALEVFEALPHVNTVWVNPNSEGEYKIHPQGTSGWEKFEREKAAEAEAEAKAEVETEEAPKSAHKGGKRK